MIETIQVSSRGQVVIPEAARKQLKISRGTKLILITKDDTLVLEKEEDFMKKFALAEKLGWLRLAEKSLEKVWNNKKDEKVWRKYL